MQNSLVIEQRKAIIAYALEKRLAVFCGEQLYIKVGREAETGDVVMFVGDFLGNGRYLTSGKTYRVFSWHGLPAIYDDMHDIVLVYEQEKRTQEHVLVFQSGSIERIYIEGGRSHWSK